MGTTSLKRARWCLGAGLAATAAAALLAPPEPSAEFLASLDGGRAAYDAGAGVASETIASDSDDPFYAVAASPDGPSAPHQPSLPDRPAERRPAPELRIAARDDAPSPFAGMPLPRADVRLALPLAAPQAAPVEPTRPAPIEPPHGLVPEPTPDPAPAEVPPPINPRFIAELHALREEVVKLAQAQPRHAPPPVPDPTAEVRRLVDELRDGDRFRRLEDEVRRLRGEGSPSSTAAPPAPAPPASNAAAVAESKAPVIRALPTDADDRFTLQVDEAEVTQVLDLLGQMAGWNVVVAPGVEGKVTLNLRDVTLDDAMAAVLGPRELVAERQESLLFVMPRKDVIARAKATAEAKAQADSARVVVSKVYRPTYIRVEDFIQLIQPLLTRQTTATDGATFSGRQDAGGVRQTDFAADPAGAAGPLGGFGQAGPPPAVPANYGVSEAVESVERTSRTFRTESLGRAGVMLPQGDAVVVRDYAEILEEVDRVLLEVDAPPLQVEIEAYILRAKLDDSTRFGVNLGLLNAGGRQLVTSGGGAAIANSSALPNQTAPGVIPAISQFAAAATGLRYGFLAGGNVAGFIEALESITETDLVSSPSLRVLNKEQANLIIGGKLGYKTQTFLNQQTIESVQFLDVGTKLRIRPFASPDGLIRMEIHPEKSSGTIDADGVPQVDTTEVTTNVMVRDGATVVIGGLIDQTVDENVGQVPVLGSIPYLGALFKTSNKSLGRSELIVLITPRIVCDPEAEARAAGLLADAERRNAYFADHNPRLSRRNLARVRTERGMRLAEQGRLAEAQDEVHQALRIRRHDDVALRLHDGLAAVFRSRIPAAYRPLPSDPGRCPPEPPVPAARPIGPFPMSAPVAEPVDDFADTITPPGPTDAEPLPRLLPRETAPPAAPTAGIVPPPSDAAFQDE